MALLHQPASFLLSVFLRLRLSPLLSVCSTQTYSTCFLWNLFFCHVCLYKNVLYNMWMHTLQRALTWSVLLLVSVGVMWLSLRATVYLSGIMIWKTGSSKPWLWQEKCCSYTRSPPTEFSPTCTPNYVGWYLKVCITALRIFGSFSTCLSESFNIQFF